MATPLKHALALAAALAIALTLTTVFNRLWREDIDSNRRDYHQRLLSEVLYGVEHQKLVREDPAAVSTKTSRVLELWQAELRGETAAIVVRASVDGYSGEIIFVAAFDTNGVRIQSRIARHVETPGIGGFLSAPDGGERAIQGVSGATITSTAVAGGVGEIGEWIKTRCAGGVCSLQNNSQNDGAGELK